MSIDILLVMVPPWEVKMPPLGIAYISQYLRSQGFLPKVIDFNAELYSGTPSKFKFFWEISNINSMPPTEIASKMYRTFEDEINALAERIVSLDCSIIGFSVSITSIGLAAKIARLIKIKDRNKIIIFGGTGCFWDNDRCFISRKDIWAIDAFVIGEGEEPLGKIVENYRSGKGFEDIEGVICNNNNFFSSLSPYHTRNIDKLPFPDFSDFDLKCYLEKSIPMLISRGCIGRCSFCIDHLICGNYRWKSPDKVLEEIKYHININKINNFHFNDLACNGNIKQLEEICDLIIESNLQMTWQSYAIIRKDMDAGLLNKMYKSGCRRICYGLESASNNILKKMGKLYTAEEAKKVIVFTCSAGIKTAVNIIVGFPGEAEEDFERTLTFIRNNREYIHEVTNVSSFVLMSPSKVGRCPHDYGVRLPLPGEDFNLFLDENGLRLCDRIKRVRRTVILLSNLNINNPIVNQPKLAKDKSKYKNTVVLIFCPSARIDLIPLRLVSLFAYLRRNRIRAIPFDFNVKLFNIVKEEIKYLWNYENLHRWSLSKEISDIFNLLDKEIFKLAEELISIGTNKYCLLVTLDNLVFSVKFASLLRRLSPDSCIILSGHILRNDISLKLIPEDTVDTFVHTDEKKNLLRIIKGMPEDIKKAHNIIPEEEVYDRQRNTAGESVQRLFNPKDFKGFDLEEYNAAKMPILLEIE